MQQIILVIHLIIAAALVGSILLQKSEGGGFAGGAAGGSGGGFMTPRGTANLLTRTTGILAVCFFVTSIGLAILARTVGTTGPIITDEPAVSSPPTEVPVPDVPLED